MPSLLIKHTVTLRLVWFLSGLMLMLACSGEHHGNNGYRPLSIRTNPYNGQVDVSTLIVLRAAFSQDMLASSLNTSSFTLSGPSGIVSGSVLYDGQYKSASFTPSTPLLMSTSYTANLSGSIMDSQGHTTPGLSWTFTTTANTTGWASAQLLESDNLGSAASPHVAADSSGNAMAVWHQFDGTRANIWASYFTAGSGWGTPVKLEFDDTDNAIYPRVAFDVSGNAIAVWQQREAAATYSNIWANRYIAGSGWGTAVLIEANNAGDSTIPDIAYSSNGTAIAVWQYFDGTANNVWSNNYTAGSWGTAVTVDIISANAAKPKVVIDSTGKATAVWYEFDGSFDSIAYSQYTGTWTTPLYLEAAGNNAYNPRLAVDANGNVMAVWYKSDGTWNNIWASFYTAGGSWTSEVLIETDNTGSAVDPTVAFDKLGNAIAVWVQSDGTRNNVWSNRYVSGSGWGTAQLIETDNTGGASAPELAIDGSGNAIAVWVHYDGVRNNIYTNRYTNGTGWGTAEFVESNNVGTASFPQITFDSNNKGIAVWHQSDGSVDNIWTNFYQ